jgi:O-antigen ligase/polysaccharide polymerase Wzy-like membrane protein
MSEVAYSYADSYGEDMSPESSPFGVLALLAILACAIDSLPSELEMFLTGGSVPIPQAVIKIGCFAFLAGLVLLYTKLDLSRFPTKVWIATVLFLSLDFGFLWFGQRKNPAEIVLAYNAYYCPLILAPIVMAIRGKLSNRTAMRIFLGTFAAATLLGWAQFILQDPVVQLASNDGNFRIIGSQWMQGGERSTRSMSFFGSAQEYGSFLVLVAAMGIGMCRRRGGWKIGVPVYLFAAASCYTTLTRATFVQLFFATIAALIFTFGRSPRRMSWQPLLAFAFALFIAFSGVTSGLGDKKSLADDGSLQVRLAQWAMYTTILQHSSTSEQLFGLGFCQADRPVMVANKEAWSHDVALIDNLYLAYTAHIGLVGATLILALLWGMWRFVRLEAIEQPAPVIIGLASFWSTFLMTGMFNIQGAYYGFWFLIVVILARNTSQIRESFAAEDPCEAEAGDSLLAQDACEAEA